MNTPSHGYLHVFALLSISYTEYKYLIQVHITNAVVTAATVPGQTNGSDRFLESTLSQCIQLHVQNNAMLLGRFGLFLAPCGIPNPQLDINLF